MFDAPQFAEGQVVGNGDVRGVIYGQDTGLYVEFRMEDVHQEFASNEAGRPIYKQVPFVRLYTPGDKTKVVDRAVKMEPIGDVPSDPQRFPQQWAAFVNGAKAAQTGTPLSEWPKVSASQVREFGNVNIYTVEQLAEVHDGALDGLGHGGRAMRDAAVVFLDKAKDGAVESKLMAEIEALRAQIAAQGEQKRGPGRPRKEEADGE